MAVTMYDSINVKALPASAEAVAGYVGGFWPDWSAEVARFPALAKSGHVVSIAVSAVEDAEALDVEGGDATPAEAPSWVRRQQARGIQRPIVYASLSVMPTVLAQLAAAGIPRTQVRVWTAHYTNNPHLCSSLCGFGFSTIADATQYTTHALGISLDASFCQDEFFRPSIHKAKNHPHYDRFDNRRRRVLGHMGTERWFVQRYDRFRSRQRPRFHPYRLRLLFLRKVLGFFAKRIAKVAGVGHRPNPAWGPFHRGWRYQQLIHRSQGMRFV